MHEIVEKKKKLVPLEQNRDDPSSVNANFFPSWLSHVEMLEGRIAPASIVVWESKIRWAEICCSNRHRSAFNTPSGISLIITYDLVALSTRSSIVE